jgi:hypothetical protein
MNAERDLLDAYREWRRLAETEGEAIRTCNWSLCAACQKALQHLRGRITALMPGLRAEWSQPGCNRIAKQQSLDKTINELIHLERRNQTLLQSIREATQTKLKQLGEAGLKLKQLRRSYGLAPGGAGNVLS